VRRLPGVYSFVFASLLLSTAFLALVATSVAAQHEFSLKAYDEFHDVLHPLEHEALPRKDFKRIRAKSGLLVKRGRAIVKGGAPNSMSQAQEQKRAFTKELKRFDIALSRFSSASRRGTNQQLKTAYSAVHDSYEMLAALLRNQMR
jgi:hypothetical protein